jgi:hypothetical protein
MELTGIGVDAIVALALEEDVGSGDVTGEATIPAGRRCNAVIVAKSSGIVAGVDVVQSVFRAVDPDIHVEMLVAVGTPIVAPFDLITIEGPARSVLAAERTALNLLGRLCGVATATGARPAWSSPFPRPSASRSLPAQAPSRRPPTSSAECLPERGIPSRSSPPTWTRRSPALPRRRRRRSRS